MASSPAGLLEDCRLFIFWARSSSSTSLHSSVVSSGLPPAGSLRREPTDPCPPVPAEDLQLAISVWNPATGRFAVVLSPSKRWCKARQKSLSALAMSDLSFHMKEVAFCISGICSHDHSPGAPAMLEVKDFASQQGGVSN